MSTRRDIFHALADPTRREILELLLQNRTMSAGEIARNFPDVARPGISRHVRVLREAGLVANDVQGRIRRYSLISQPFVDLEAAWLSKFVKHHSQSLSALRKIVEEVGAEKVD